MGGVIFSLAHLSAVLNDPLLCAEAEALAESVPALIEGDHEFDLLAGSAGCVMGLLALHHVSPSDATLFLARRCGEHLLAQATPSGSGIGWVGREAGASLSGMAHGAAGISLALMKLGAVAGDDRFVAAARAAIDFERELFDETIGNWRDLRRIGSGDHGATGMVAWCHGASGIALARIHCVAIHDGIAKSEIRRAVATTLARGYGQDHSLCHGDLGRLELMIDVGLRVPDLGLHGPLTRCAHTILDQMEDQGWICSRPGAVEIPGLMSGLAGIGYSMLRLAFPGLVPSVLSLAEPILVPSRH